MCGMKKRRTSSKTANDPKSKINAALRVWGCRCDTNESTDQSPINLIIESKKKMKNPCWKGYEAVGMKKKNGKNVPNCVPIKESQMNPLQMQIKEKFLTEGCGCGGGNKPKPKPKPKPIQKPKAINEEVKNEAHRGKMTRKMIRSRDKRAKKLKGIAKVVVKGDTPENARHRLATYIEWKMRGGKKNKNSAD